LDRLRNTLYNLDRAIASMGGSPPEETISSMVGRIDAGEIIPSHEAEIFVAHRLTEFLNLIDPGHTIRAIAHANELEHQNGKE